MLKTKSKLPKFDGKPHHFKTWKIGFEGWLLLKGNANILDIETKDEIAHRRLERDGEDYKKWRKESRILFYILHEAMPYNLKKLIENHTFEDGKASYLYIIEHVTSASKMRMLALIRQLKDMKMKDHDDPDVFIGKYLDIVSSLKDGGYHLPEDDQILELLDKLPSSYSTFRDIQLLTPPESVKDLQNLLHIWFNNKRHSSNQREKALTSFAKEKNNTKDKVETLPVGSVERRVTENRNAKIALNKSDSWIKNQSMLRLHDAPMHA